MQALTDIYNRNFKTLRVSLLNTCNLSCTYCTMGENDVSEINKIDTINTTQLINTIQQLHKILQFKTIRFTGGEPLLYPNLIDVIQAVKSISIPEIKLTTNGLLLDRMAEKLKNAGLQSINVSLDAIDENIFFLISNRHHIEKIITGIKKAIHIGLQVKINSVIMKGTNNNQLLPLLDFAFKNNITIRFLEIMAMGHLHSNASKYLFTQDEILATIATKYSFKKINRTNASTANYWKTNTGNTFGIIANQSEPFCKDCNRLRLDSKGNIYGCLSNNNPISINNITDSNILLTKLQQAMNQKQTTKFMGSNLSMLQIGG